MNSPCQNSATVQADVARENTVVVRLDCTPRCWCGSIRTPPIMLPAEGTEAGLRGQGKRGVAVADFELGQTYQARIDAALDPDRHRKPLNDLVIPDEVDPLQEHGWGLDQAACRT